MHDVGGVNVFQSAEKLVQEELAVLVGELLVGLDDLGEVGFHQL